MNIEKRNIFLENTAEKFKFISPLSGGGKRSFPVRENPEEHAKRILQKLETCQQSLSNRQVAAIHYKNGLYLEFSGKLANDLKTESLENLKQGIRLLNIREEGDTKKATVYVPDNKVSYFLKKASDYRESIGVSKNPKNNDLIRSIEDIRLAVVESFWIGDASLIPGDENVWCEVWLRSGIDFKTVVDLFDDFCKEHQVNRKKGYIQFPERVVVMLLANRETLDILITECAYVAELRRVPESTSFFDKLCGLDQQQWVEDLKDRVHFTDSNSSVCILDTGIASNHPLLKSAIMPDGVQCLEKSWGVEDHDGHGTGMAGVALYNDLKEALESPGRIEINHKIESVKILPPSGGNNPELYGELTKRAVLLSEIANTNVDRSICMAVTADPSLKDGRPSSWSGAVDSITSGADGDDKQLMLISVGNVCPQEFQRVAYPDANLIHTVEDPAQAWNALAVGAYNNDIDISDPDYKGCVPVADVGELSPYSSTSVTWSNKWPVKPDILFNGSNVATNGADYTECSDYALLTTAKNYLRKPFDRIWATSAATAQAAYMSAELYAAYPGIWPETIRALMVHSASWTDKMKQQFCKDDKKSTGRRQLLRTCGYGIPDINRAIQCADNSVNLVLEGELQPFLQDGSKVSMNEMHLHTVPWPKEVLESLGNIPAQLKVTLSYFVEPGPGEIGWKDKYRYASCGLRFDVINKNESVDDFKKRINKCMREDKSDKGNSGSGSERWYLGSDNRDVGSIHSDFMELNAIDLCDMNYIAVYPVIGWWRERAYLGRCNNSIRYSLVVSISTPREGIDLYTPITTKITTTIPVIA